MWMGYHLKGISSDRSGIWFDRTEVGEHETLENHSNVDL